MGANVSALSTELGLRLSGAAAEDARWSTSSASSGLIRQGRAGEMGSVA